MIPVLILGASFVVYAAFATNDTTGDTVGGSHRQQVETLFRLTRMEQKINDSVESVVQLQLRQNPALADKKAVLTGFINKYMGWQALKEDIAAMYMKNFTEDELRQINAFYITPAGQKVINTVPQLVKQRNQLAMQRLQQHIGELRQVLQVGP